MSTRNVIEDPLTYYDFSVFESVHEQRGLILQKDITGEKI